MRVQGIEPQSSEGVVSVGPIPKPVLLTTEMSLQSTTFLNI